MNVKIALRKLVGITPGDKEDPETMPELPLLCPPAGSGGCGWIREVSVD